MRKVGAGWQNEAGCKQLVSEDVAALLYLPGVKVRRSGATIGTFLWGPHFIPFSHQKSGKQHLEDMIPGLPELHLYRGDSLIPSFIYQVLTGNFTLCQAPSSVLRIKSGLRESVTVCVFAEGKGETLRY